MSDHDVATDPVDQAYVEAEASLDDETARAARRARVLGAAALQTGQPERPPQGSPSPWRRGGWLAAASVAGVAVLLAARLYQPFPRQPPAAETPPPTAAATSAKSAASAAVGPTPARPEPPSQILIPSRPRPAHPVSEPPTPAPVQNVRAAPSAEPAPPPPSPPPSAPPAPGSFAASSRPSVIVALKAPPSPATAATAPSGSVGEVVVTGSRIVHPDFGSARTAWATRSSAEATADAQSDPAVRLRTAALAGKTAEIQDLLAEGAPVDAPDYKGNTALMDAILGDHPEAAALLRRYGASLDQKNRAGLSARDMAANQDDPALNQAIGLAP